MRHLLFVLFLNVTAFAAPSSLTYQGRILKSNGTALEHNSVSFLFQITSPNGLCVVYEEQVNGIDMTNSGGVFDAPIGLGSRSFPASGSFTILDSLNNSSSLGCKGGSTYNPVVTDGRLLRVQFHDGSGWKLISPDNVIRSVPYAGYAASALKLGTNVVEDFVLKAGLPTCAASTFLSWDGSALSCAPVVGSSGGTVTNVTSGNAYLSVVNGTSTPALTLNVGTSSNTVAAGNDSRFTDARTPTGAASGDLSGSYPGPTVAKIQGVDVSSAAPASGNFLKFNGTNWLGAALAVSDISGLSTTLGGLVQYSQIPTTCTSSQTLTFISPVGGFSCTNIQVTGASFAAQSAGTVLAGPTSGSAAPTFRALALSDLPSSITDATWTAASGNVYRASGNVGIGTTAPGYILDLRTAAPVSQLHISGTNADSGGYLMGYDENTSYFTSGVSYNGANWVAKSTLASIVGHEAGTISFYNNASLTAGNTYTPTKTFQVNRDGLASIKESLAVGALTTAGVGRVEVIDTSGSAIRGLVSSQFSTNNIGGGIVGRKARGTYVSPTAIVNGDHVASLIASPYDGSAFLTTAFAGYLVDGAVSVGTVPTAFIINTGSTGVTGGTERVRITSSGDVGIGTTTPTTKLEVVGTIKATGFEGPLTATSSGTGTGSNSAPSYSFSADTDTGFYNASSNNTISVATGGAKIFDFSSLGLVSPTTGGASVSTALGTASAPTFSFAGDTDTGWYRAAADTMAAATAGTERMRIDSSGRVGIGTTSPSTTLDVDGTVRFDSAGGHVMSFGVSDAFNIDAYANATRIRTESSATNVIVTPLIVEGKPFGASPSLGTGTAISFANTTTTSTAREMASIGAVWTAFAEANHSADIFFSTVNAGSGAATASEVMRIKSNGKVGIGTNNPLGLMHTYGDGSFVVDRPGGHGLAGSHVLIRASGGTVASPSTMLTNGILGSVNFSGYDGTDWSTLITAAIQGVAAEDWTNSSHASELSFFTTPSGGMTGTERLRINKNGNVGIGTASPSQKLDVVGNVSGQQFQSDATNVETVAGTYTATKMVYKFNESRGIGYNSADDALYFAMTESVPMVIDNSGNIGIGTTNPTEKLTVSGNIILNSGIGTLSTSGDDLVLAGTSTSAGAGDVRVELPVANNNRFGVRANSVELFTVRDTGNVGIGTLSPSYKLDVAGDIRITGTPYRSGGDIAWQVPSDARLKDVAGPYQHGLNDLIQLDMIRFHYKNNNPVGADTSKEYIGVLAQDVQKVIPEAVTEDPKTGFLSLNTTPIFWALVNGIKDLNHRINELFSASDDYSRRLASLEAENAQIKAENSKMKARLDEIEKKLSASAPGE